MGPHIPKKKVYGLYEPGWFKNSILWWGIKENNKNINERVLLLSFLVSPFNTTFDKKPGSLILSPSYLRYSCRYCLRHRSDMRTEVAGNRDILCQSVQPARRRSWLEFDFAGMLEVKTDMASVAGDFCSHIRTMSQAVPVAMSQVFRQHNRTRLNRAP